MAKFHVTPKGQARECNAQTPEACRYSQQSGKTVEHYETREEAQAAYEKQQQNKPNFFAEFTKKEKPIQQEKPELTPNEKKQILREYETDAQRYNKFMNSSGGKPSLENIVRMKKMIADLANKIEPVKNIHTETEDIYIENLEEYHKQLRAEKEALQKEYKKAGKTTIGSMFSSQKKEEQESELAKISQNIHNNATETKTLESRYSRFKNSVQRKRLQKFHDKGYETITNFSGLNMSLHPQGPKFSYACPKCNTVNETRLYENKGVKNTGYITECDSCHKQSVLPITRNSIETENN